MSEFSALFVQRSTSTLLQVVPIDEAVHSRIGGAPPDTFDTAPLQDAIAGYQYLFTLSDTFSAFIGGNDLSVFLPANYEEYSSQPHYPSFKLKCIIHPHSAGYSNNKQLIYPALKAGSLVELPKVAETSSDEEVAYFLKIGGLPYLLQDENYYYEGLEAAGYQFVFQLDENGLTADFL
jgi:hypothetical protein